MVPGHWLVPEVIDSGDWTEPWVLIRLMIVTVAVKERRKAGPENGGSY